MRPFSSSHLLIELNRILDIATELTGKAPDPVLGVGVRQGGRLIAENLNVSPGTPLQMEIFLDSNSSSVYGIGVNYMQVSDTRNQEETIIFNGSVGSLKND